MLEASRLLAIGHTKIKNYWKDTFVDEPPLPTLSSGEMSFDAIVVGGGACGLSAAHTFSERGLKVLVIDADEIGGNSAKSGGILSYDNDFDIRFWISEIGSVRTRQLINDTVRGAIALSKLANDWNLDAPVRCGAVGFATNQRGLSLIKEEVVCQKELGLKPELLTADEVRDRISSSRLVGGYFNPDVSVINPYRLFRNLARELTRRYKCSFLEHEAVIAVDEREHLVRTARGVYTAPHIVISTGPSLAKWTHGPKATLPLTSAIAVTRPLLTNELNRLKWKGRSAYWEMGNVFSYFRILDDNRILYGLGVSDVFGDERENASYYERAVQAAQLGLRDLLDLRVEIEYVWAGVIQVTEDYLPDVRINPDRGVAFASGAALPLSWWIGRSVACALLEERGTEVSLWRDVSRKHLTVFSLIFRLPIPRRLKEILLNIARRFE